MKMENILEFFNNILFFNITCLKLINHLTDMKLLMYYNGRVGPPRTVNCPVTALHESRNIDEVHTLQIDKRGLDF
jgi:hypothetical protein